MTELNDERNTRFVCGAEDFIIQTNQQMFANAREGKTKWYGQLLRLVDNVANCIAEVEGKCSPEVADNLRLFAAFMISNYVPRERLLQTAPKNWKEVVENAKPQVKEPLFWLGDNQLNIPELMLKLQTALRADFESMAVALHDR